MLLAADGSREMARACALLSERYVPPPRTATTSSDLLSALDRWHEMPAGVRRCGGPHCGIRIADCGLKRIRCGFATRAAADVEPATSHRASIASREAAFRRAVLAGYPDRVAHRREPGATNVLLASGTGATIARESGVHDAEFVVALDVYQPSARSGRDRQARR